MKIAIIYLSLSGNTSFVADYLQSHLKGEVDLYPLIIDENVPKSQLFQTLKFGMKTILNKPINYNCELKSVKDYDLLIIGTPVWADRIPSPVRILLSDLDLSEIKVAVYCTYDTEPGLIIDQLHAFTNSRPYVGVLEIKTPVSNQQKQKENQISEFMDEISINMLG